MHAVKQTQLAFVDAQSNGHIRRFRRLITDFISSLLAARSNQVAAVTEVRRQALQNLNLRVILFEIRDIVVGSRTVSTVVRGYRHVAHRLVVHLFLFFCLVCLV